MFILNFVFFLTITVIVFLFLAINYLVRHSFPHRDIKVEHNFLDTAFLIFLGVICFLWLLNFIWFLIF